MKGYWTEASYVGYMPNGRKRWFVSYDDYVEAYNDALKDSDD